ncbi:hypothetical protein Nepgr_015394 [Nepenthes gracilis]|uniref:Uncharacterized protein n=1 Tax=Nepenthes gracilis TaxID=150966 RepID=A0AAD3SLL7_NEPGR|nr:hypothetical protein Nepgr_015394 [Nepenthes gracilis]
MSVRTPWTSWIMRGLLELRRLRSSWSGNSSEQYRHLISPTRNFVYIKPAPLGLRLISSRSGGMGNCDKPPLPTPSPPPASPLPPTPPRNGFPKWVRWFWGSMLSLVLTFWMPKLGTLLRIGGEAELILEEVEKVAEVVEKAATVAEKVSADVANQLPDGNRFKDAALLIEHVSEEAVKDAHLAEQIIHKVDAVKTDLEDMEKLTEHVFDKFFHENHPRSSARPSAAAKRRERSAEDSHRAQSIVGERCKLEEDDEEGGEEQYASD